MKKTPRLRKKLRLLGEHPAHEHKLYQCQECLQMWQQSHAWNWGDHAYLFKVPHISTEDWLTDPYIRPDELLIYAVMMEDYVEQNPIVRVADKCRKETCTESAIEGSVFCFLHHVQSLQAVHLLPQEPSGKWFPPYDRISIYEYRAS